MRAVGDRRRRRLEVTAPGAVAPWEAAHQGGDVGEPPKLLGIFKPGANHPTVELLSGAARERAARLALDRTGSLADEKKWRAPPAFESWIGLRNDPLVHTNVACPALSLKQSQLIASAHEPETNGIPHVWPNGAYRWGAIRTCGPNGAQRGPALEYR